MLSVGDAPAQVRAAVLALKSAGRDLRSDINKATRETMNPVWRSLVSEHATSLRDRDVIARGARIKAGNPPAAVAATSRRPLSGGLVPADDWQPIEFGTGSRAVATTYRRRSPNGGTHSVTRRTRTGLPQHRRGGRVAYPAVADIAPRMVSLWVQLIVRKYHEAAEKGS